MSETPKLLLQKDGPIGWIIFNQPEKRNAVSLEMWQLMPDYVRISPTTTRSVSSSCVAPAIRRSWPAPTSLSSRSVAATWPTRRNTVGSRSAVRARSAR